MIEFPVIALKEIGAAAEVELSYWQSLFAGPEHARIVDAGIVAVVLNAALEHGLVRLPVGDDTPDYNKGQGLDLYYIGLAQGKATAHRYPEAKRPQTYGGEPERQNDDERELDSFDDFVFFEPGDDELVMIEPGNDLDEDEPAETQADLIQDPKPYDKVVAAVLGPEHTPNTPLRPIGRDRLPDPDVARGRLALAIAAGSDETRELVSLASRARAQRAPERVPAPARTLAEADELAAELSSVIVAMQAMAVDGEIPAILVWDGERPGGLPNWRSIQTRHGVASWATMAAMAGLSVGKVRHRATIHEPATRTRPGPKSSDLPTRHELIAELKRQSMGGIMPSQAIFNDAKPANWASATAHLIRLEMSWDELAKEAGLKPRQRGPVAQPQAA